MTNELDDVHPDNLGDALALLHQRESELRRASQQLAQARQELEDTNRGLIALHTELQAAQQAEARLAAVVQSSDDAIISMAPDCLIQTWNPGADRLLGHPEERVIGQPVQVLMPPESQELFAAALQQIHSHEHAEPYETQWRRADGNLIDVAVNLFTLRDPGVDLAGFSVIARDITTQIAAQRQLERLAHFDILTGLTNRAEAFARLEAALARPRSPGPHLGLLFCDVDHFKTVNDTWGHAAGDIVLATLAQRFCECVRQGDTVGRTGGDEMLVVLPGVHGIDDVARIGEKIRRRAAETIDYDGQPIHTTVSIGATIATPGESVLSITARADAAMYQAKRSGRNTVTRI